MIQQQLFDIRRRALSVRNREVGTEVVQRGLDFSYQVIPEVKCDQFSGTIGATFVIVQQHKRQVVPVFRLATAVRGSGFRKQESGESGHIDLDSANLAVVNSG